MGKKKKNKMSKAQSELIKKSRQLPMEFRPLLDGSQLVVPEKPKTIEERIDALRGKIPDILFDYNGNGELVDEETVLEAISLFNELIREHPMKDRVSVLDFPVVQELFLNRIASDMSVKAALSGIATNTVLNNVFFRNKQFFDRYHAAKSIQYHSKVDELLDISDGKDEYEDKSVRERSCMINTRKWMLEKLIPNVYGKDEKSGSGGNVTINIPTIRVDGSELDLGFDDGDVIDA